jgi:RNA polymerase sigma factor (TIGR02999 family)
MFGDPSGKDLTQWNVDAKIPEARISECSDRDPVESGVEPQLIGPFLSSVYDEMHSLTVHYMRSERPNHTLQPTALLNETFARLITKQSFKFQSRNHFVATAAAFMRGILIDYARQRATAKRACGAKLELNDAFAFVEPRVDELLIVDEALSRLAQVDSRQARVVELIFFGGLTAQQAADVMGVHVRTVKRDWRSARAWLQTHLTSRSPQDPD